MDPSTIQGVFGQYLASQQAMGTQVGGAIDAADPVTIDAQLANEIFDVTYLLYKEGVEGVPPTLTLGGRTATFNGPTAYIPYSAPAFGEMGGDISSLRGYQAISTQKAGEYESAERLLQTYSTQYVSVSQTIASYEVSLEDTLESLKTLGIESTILFEQIKTLDAKAAKESVELALAFNDQEKATYEYRESYVREKRVEIQNLYEDSIRNEIATISSQRGATLAAAGDTSTVVDYATLINMDATPIKTHFDNFQRITTGLQVFSNLYAAYDNRGYFLSNYYDDSTAYMTLQSEYTSLIANNLTAPNNSSIVGELGTTYTGLVQKGTLLTQYASDLGAYDIAVNTKKGEVTPYLDSYIDATQRATIEASISSILTGGYNTGYASAS
jgi:hypothetical protein